MINTLTFSTLLSLFIFLSCLTGCNSEIDGNNDKSEINNASQKLKPVIITPKVSDDIKTDSLPKRDSLEINNTRLEKKVDIRYYRRYINLHKKPLIATNLTNEMWFRELV
ncbi:MAG: hypothetical protein ACK40G_05865 [Cytophagaceae bacterium]